MDIVFFCAGASKRMNIYKTPKWNMGLGNETILERHLRMWAGHEKTVVVGKKNSDLLIPSLGYSKYCLDPVYGNAWDTLVRVMPSFKGETLFILGDTVYDWDSQRIMEKARGGPITAFSSCKANNVWSYGKDDETYAVKMDSPAALADEARKIRYDGYSLQKLRGWHQLDAIPLATCRDIDYPIDYYLALKALGLPWIAKLMYSPLPLHWKGKIFLEALYVR